MQDRPKIALYSHDTYGLGHLRRSLRLARALERWGPEVDVLLITGSPRAHFFELPGNVEVVKLPSVTKDSDGHYVSRVLAIPLEDTIRMRKGIIRESILAFDPDVLVVDHAPMGLRGELLPLLGDLRHRSSTELVLGLRDILDDPGHVVRSWSDTGTYRLLESIYHHTWVYGSREVFALEDLYDMPPVVAEKLVYLGHLGREKRAEHLPSNSRGFPDPKRPHLLCLLGGGGDGFPLARAFLGMLERFPDRWNGTLITGPFLSKSKRQRVAVRAAEIPHAHALRFSTIVEDLMLGSDAVITMGGYNAMMEAVSLNRKTLVVPRVFPRREQWLRADAFQRLGLVASLDPEELDAETLGARTEGLLAAGPPPTPHDCGLPWDGARAFAERIGDLLERRGKERHGDASEDLRRA